MIVDENVEQLFQSPIRDTLYVFARILLMSIADVERRNAYNHMIAHHAKSYQTFAAVALHKEAKRFHAARAEERASSLAAIEDRVHDDMAGAVVPVVPAVPIRAQSALLQEVLPLYRLLMAMWVYLSHMVRSCWRPIVFVRSVVRFAVNIRHSFHRSAPR